MPKALEKSGLLLVQLLRAQSLSSRAAKLSFTLLLGSLVPDLILLAFTHPLAPTEHSPLRSFSCILMPATRHSVCRAKEDGEVEEMAQVQRRSRWQCGTAPPVQGKVFPFPRRPAAPA